MRPAPSHAPARFLPAALLRATLSVALVAALAACGGSDDDDTPAASPRSVASLRLIGEQRIAFKQTVQDTPAGGLSGIDYDPRIQRWMVVSDDRSDLAPARLYEAQLSYDDKAFTRVALTSAVTLKQPDGSVYPSATQFAQRGGTVPDPEAIRFDPSDSSLWVTSEGNRSLGLDPLVLHVSNSGAAIGQLTTPPLFKMSPSQELGSRNNATYEGLTFAPDGQSLWVAMEGPVYQDGPLPSATAGAVSRITRQDRTGKVLSQFAYPLDAFPAAPAAGKNADNGVSEILAINDTQFLVLERAGIEGADGVYSMYLRLYRIDVTGATDVQSLSTLRNAQYTPVRKTLVVDFNRLGLPRIDNLEGMTWGPRLPNGRESLVIVSDDNFSATQVTQFLAFEVVPN
ncbi:esterase-like activity of phytase family protein [Pigmentiphaga litoralis]|uniref:Phytase-like domain-containing protein n=1 Tax=Pigmentiphaga litoralis TaxID=516702 RepID=A0A7Y9LNR8_9BURK|nr:esterase-like activity of phytase family protein [Pigmentiphaga litoralis]NYE22882.1 hypothetical protein [Pigmentiphaga litoralis]NYE83503.1 hypothetical protein [Pigmentiphaga litoralis]